MRAHSSRKLLLLAILSAIALLVLRSLKKVTTSEYSTTVYNLLLVSGLNPTISKFATAQAAHETGGFTSAIFKSNNNLFGMKYAGQVNSIGEKNGYANYLSVNNSVADLVAWYTRHRVSLLFLPVEINTVEKYVKFLKDNNYFEATLQSYTAAVKKFYNMIFDV